MYPAGTCSGTSELLDSYSDSVIQELFKLLEKKQPAQRFDLQNNAVNPSSTKQTDVQNPNKGGFVLPLGKSACTDWRQPEAL